MSAPSLVAAAARRRLAVSAQSLTRSHIDVQSLHATRVLSRASVAPKCSVRHYQPAAVTAGQRRAISGTSRKRQATPASEEDFNPFEIERESDQVDVCIVGGGPAGLCAAIKLKQLANEAGKDEFRVLLLEKAGEIGDHIVSGNVLEPGALDELLPDWRSEDNPNAFTNITAATVDKMRFLTEKSSIPIPAPPQMNNHGNFIISLNELTKWLAERAEEIGVEIYAGFAASEVLYNSDGSVKGVATNDLGIGRDGKPKDSFERGMEFHARCTLLAEGCHGSLTKKVIKKFDLRKDSQVQTYGLGIKEVWEIDPAKFEKGLVAHSMGYPLPADTYGGGWMYHFGENMVSIGLVVGLDYPNPWMAPYGEFQKMKHHPFYAKYLEGGKCISYGARTLNEGGFQSIPKCAFPGGALIGDTAGFLNVPKIKGTHTAMRSGMLAAEAAFSAVSKSSDELGAVFLYDYEDALRNSSIWKELKEVRNMRPSFHSPLGLYGGIIYSGLEAFLFKGKTPWTLSHAKEGDSGATKPASAFKKIEYPKPDGKISFDILTSVSRTGTNHEEDQPCHLQVADYEKHAQEHYPKYQGVENRFCPAGVYEYVEDESKELGVRFQINSQNCVHCKTCDIKVPGQDITWQTPQGGEGPKYVMT
jgi:electron-transferring-flavoprotein dehydrogenase